MADTLVRVGIPHAGGQLVAAARRRRMPVLFSANAFARTYGARHEWAGDFRSFRLPDPAQFEGLDAALDSGGFVAAARYGDYRWTVEQYLDLVASNDWAWWSSMDLCCEPEVAADKPLRLLRMAATAQLLAACRCGARDRGLSMPMPILQGWTPDEYVQSAMWLPILDWPDLVGVGSVCRRPIHGPTGLLAVLEAVDAVLPDHVRLHLFGVKSEALELLAGHPRIASVDSMAWDFGARAQKRVGRDAAYRIGHMHAWTARQSATVHRAPAARARVGWTDGEAVAPSARPGRNDLVCLALAQQLAELVLESQIEYRDAVVHLVRDSATACALVTHAAGPTLLEDLDEVIAGLGEAFGQLCDVEGVR